METIRFADFDIIPVLSSARRARITDNVYFGPKYTDYISNSRLSKINPVQGGSICQYKKGVGGVQTPSLALGSAIHQLILQKNEYKLGPKCNKPTAKLGAVLDKVKKYRKMNMSIHDSIVKASIECNYYVNQIESKVNKVISEGLKYYWNTKHFDDSIILLNDKDWESCKRCVENVNNDVNIQNVLHPKDDFMDDIPSFNEDTIFLDVIVTYKNRLYSTLHLKMKADNWTIDVNNEVLTLNDLKTTSKPLNWFMNPDYGSFYKYHYYRQFALYITMLQYYCVKEYGFNKNWTTNMNILAVNTVDYSTRLFNITQDQLKKGRKEYEHLLKMITYYKLFGVNKEVNFE